MNKNFLKLAAFALVIVICLSFGSCLAFLEPQNESVSLEEEMSIATHEAIAVGRAVFAAGKGGEKALKKFILSAQNRPSPNTLLKAYNLLLKL